VDHRSGPSDPWTPDHAFLNIHLIHFPLLQWDVLESSRRWQPTAQLSNPRGALSVFQVEPIGSLIISSLVCNSTWQLACTNPAVTLLIQWSICMLYIFNDDVMDKVKGVLAQEWE
jgi:hypothetical protein